MPSFDDVMKWLALLKEVDSCTTLAQRRAWSQRANKQEDRCEHCSVIKCEYEEWCVQLRLFSPKLRDWHEQARELCTTWLKIAEGRAPQPESGGQIDG